MKQFQIVIDIENAAFDPDPQEEIARLLVKLATKLLDHNAGDLTEYNYLNDINGNAVLEYTIEDTEND
jgi:hypothetical protein